MKKIRQLSLLLTVIAIFFASCSPSVSLYDQHSYEQITSLKVEALHVMDFANAPIANHQKEVDAVIVDLEKAREYELHRPKNKATTAMWSLILDIKAGSFAEFIDKWMREGTQNKAFIDGAKKAIGKHFDDIADAESSKSKGK